MQGQATHYRFRPSGPQSFIEEWIWKLVAYKKNNFIFLKWETHWIRGTAHTLKKFTKVGSSGASVAVETVGDGSRGPSISDMDGNASSSSNSLSEGGEEKGIRTRIKLKR